MSQQVYSQYPAEQREYQYNQKAAAALVRNGKGRKQYAD